MNKQGIAINGKVRGGIEWTKTVLPDGTEQRGYTWNPISGCQHGCRWNMPDGQVAVCYAESAALREQLKQFYPEGFGRHYWNPARLDEPLRIKTPSRIFLDSMSDLMGAWVPPEQIEAVLATCRQAHWHTFQLLTKNAPRLRQFDFPGNVWLGVSSPPDSFRGRVLNLHQQKAMLKRSLETLNDDAFDRHVTWMSFEPLSGDVAGIVQQYPDALRWAVIGAASNGGVYYQPDPEHVNRLLNVLDAHSIPVFFKGNLDWDARREDFPE